jgi:acyl-CoA reductase-like NAD-dependent aldehyde dehydrogenase
MTTLTAAPTTTLASINPADGSVVGTVVVAGPAEVAAAVARARAAQPAWHTLGAEARAARLRPAGTELVARAESLGLLITREMGKPLREAIGEVKSCGESLEESLREMIEALVPETLEDEHARSFVYHDPFGVCAAITPWNFPLAMPHWLVLPALVAGNTVVLKPSEETPLIAQAYADLLSESLPPGVLGVVHGADATGRALVAADVDLIAFTGSREVGKQILGAAAPALKRVILELGGKDPLIVLDDADVAAAAKFAARNCFRNAGQVCVSTERIYVDERVADAFERELLRLTAEQIVGEPTQDGVAIGPMVNARQAAGVRRKIDAAVAAGARLAAGGAAPPARTGTAFVAPTVLTDVTHGMEIMREETFGPVACIMRVRGADEAVALANDSRFGLGAVVFGRDEARARTVARRLAAGMIGVNKSCGGAGGAPWVGARESGYGYHSGRDGHRQFAQVRVITTPKS